MGIWDWNIVSDKLTWSDTIKVLLGEAGLSFDETFESFISFVHPQDRDLINRSMECAIEEGGEYNIEYRVVLPDGNIRWLASQGLVFRNSSGKAMRMSGIDMDITARKKAQQALEVHASQQALVAELSQAALAGIDLNSLMQQAVTTIAQCLEVEYCKISELLPDGDLMLRSGIGWHSGLAGTVTVNAADNSQASYTITSQEPVIVEDLTNETRFKGSQLLLEHNVVSGLSVVIHGKESPFGILGAHTTKKRRFSRDDIFFLQAIANILATAIERQRMEDALRESEQRWQFAIKGTNDGIWDWNIKNQHVFHSIRSKEILGYQEEEIGNNVDEWFALVHPDDIDLLMQTIQTHFDKKIPFYISEHRLRCKNGTYKWILERARALWDDSGNVLRMAGSHTDITERKLAEEQLRQSEQRFQILARATNDAVWDWNLLTNKMWWNDSVQTLFGYSAESIEGNIDWWYERVHPEDRRRIVADIQAVVESAQPFWANEYRFLKANGSYAYIFDRGYVVRDDAEEKPLRMIGAMMDITERKRVQEQLVRQNLRSQLFSDITLKIRTSLQIDEILQTSVTEVQKLLNADRVLILRVFGDGSIKAVKEALVPGLPVVLGQNIDDACFSREYLEQYRKGRIKAITDIEQANIQPCHVELLKRFNIKSNLVVPIIMQNQLWGLLIAHQCARPREWNEWETELLRQLADQIGIAVSQAKLLEQETRQREELTRSNEELQQFAFIASHDLQEPLRKITAFGDRLKATCQDALTDKGHDYLQRMQNAAERMQVLIEDLLTLSRITTRAQPFVEVNLARVTKEVLSDLEIRIAQTGAHIEIGELSTIKADPLQMRQLLQNLISNALKFHPEKEPPIVKIHSQKFTNQQLKSEYYEIIVEDNGIGFEEKYLDRIFNVFQRLHGRTEYEGTGMGLAICRKIVERHQGSITAKSEPGKGASFIVTIRSEE